MNTKTLVLWCLCVAVAGRATAGTGSFTIVYKPTPDAVPYDAQAIERLATHDEKAEPDWQVREIKELVMKETLAGSDGALNVKCTVVGQAAFDSADHANAPDPASFEHEAYAYQISPRGERLLDPGMADPAWLIAPVFPRDPISVGAKWTTEAKLAEAGDVPLKVEHELVGIETIQGRPCAVVVSEGEAKDKAPSGKAGLVFRGSARTVVSLTDGILISSTANTSLTVKLAVEPGKPAKLNRRETVRMLQRREGL